MLQEWDKRGCYANGLAWRYIHVVHQIGAFHDKLALITSEGAVLQEFAFVIQLRVRLCNPEAFFIVGGAIVYLVGDKGFDPHFSVT